MKKWEIVEFELYEEPFLKEVNGDWIHKFDEIMEMDGKLLFREDGDVIRVLMTYKNEVINLSEYEDLVSGL